MGFKPETAATAPAPATWEERGVHVPFTSPPLFGARVRRTSRGLVYIVLNPAGVQGQYVVPFAACDGFAVPTVHDRLLADRIAALRELAPGPVRLAANGVAATGAAGEAARDAALAAGNESERARAWLERALLDEAGDEAGCASLLGCAPAEFGKVLLRLASCLSGLTLPGEMEGRLARAAQNLRQAAASIENWSELQGRRWAPLARFVTPSLRQASLRAEEALRRASALSGTPTQLAAAWRADAARVRQVLTLPGWLLDGWPELACLWEIAEDDEARRLALAEIAVLLPPWPAEIGAPRTAPAPIEPGGLPRDMPTPDLVARNERVRTMTA